MASFTLERPSVFPTGTTVSVYPASNWPDGQPSGTPIGAKTTEGTVASDKVTFNGLTEGVTYAATAEVGGARRYLSLLIPVAKEESGSGGTIVAVRKALGVAAATPEEFGAKSEEGHDDAEAIAEAIAKVVEEGQENGSNYGEIHFGARTYFLERDPVEGGDTEGNAQIPLPVISPETDQKFTLLLKGVGDATAGPHFHQGVVQGSGTVLDCMLTEGSSGSWGVPSVIGGPTKFDDPSGTVSFSNMLLVLDGITIRQQRNPVVIGVDARQLAACNVGTLACLARATVAEMGESLPTNELGIGLYMPLTGNNDDCNIGLYTSYGHHTGIVVTEHVQANRIANIYGNTGLVVVGLKNEGSGPELSNQAQHGAFIGMLSSEQMKTAHIEAVGDGEHCRFPLVIGLMSCESCEGTHDIIDPEDILLGQINWENIAGEPGVGAAPRLSGATGLNVTNLYEGA